MTQPAKNIQGRERPQLSTVLWLSGNETDYARVAKSVADLDLSMHHVDGAARLLAVLKRRSVALCVIDLANGSDGAEALRAVRTGFPKSVPVALVDRSRTESVLEAFKGGAFDVLASPVAPADFAAVARNAEEFLALASAGPGPAPDESNLNGIVAVSESMQRLTELVPRLAARGESRSY